MEEYEIYIENIPPPYSMVYNDGKESYLSRWKSDELKQCELNSEQFEF